MWSDPQGSQTPNLTLTLTLTPTLTSALTLTLALTLDPDPDPTPKVVRLKEEGARVVQQREEILTAMASHMPTPMAAGSAASAAAPDGFEWGATF